MEMITGILGRLARTVHSGRIASGLALLALAGCAVGPNYHGPDEKVPAVWTGIVPPEPPSTSAVARLSVPTGGPSAVTNWWAAFREPRLDSLIARAAQANLDLKQAESRVRQARAQRAVAAGGYWPAVDANGEYQWNRSASVGSSPANLYQAGLDASWELDLFGGARRGVEAADADLAASVEDLRDVMVTLSSEVAINYIGLRGLQQQIVIAKDNLAAQEHTADLTRKRFHGGFNSKLDVANAEADAAMTRSQIPALESAARQTIYALSVLLAREPSALVAELDAPAPIPLTPPAVPVGLPSDLLRRRPDIRRAEAQLHGATARIGVATADLFPKFSLTGALGTSGNRTASLVNWDHRFYSIGPTVSWALLDGGRIRANIQVQSELEKQALLDYEKAVLAALNDVESALVAYVKEQQHRQALVEAVAANREAVALSTELFTEGQTDFLSVLIPRRSLLAAQDALVQSDRTVATDLVAVYKALGGGWDAPAAPAAPAGARR